LSPEEAQKELEKTAEENNVAIPGENEINKKALKDFAAYASELKKQGNSTSTSRLKSRSKPS
jgi:hypothetical protein